MRHQANSSMIKSIRFVDSKNELEIEFKNGKIYSYPKVTQEEFEAFKNAESHGKHFNNCFKNRPCNKLG